MPSLLRSYANCPDNTTPPDPAVPPPGVAPPEAPAPSSPTIGSITILAVQDGPSGYIHFAPHVPPAARREIADNLAWFDRSDARRTRLGNAVCSNWLPRAKVGPFALTLSRPPGKVPAKEHSR